MKPTAKFSRRSAAKGLSSYDKTPCSRNLTRWRRFVRLLEPTAYAKQRIILLTDIENELDDTQSMVRFLIYSNQWEIEVLVATTSVHQRDKASAWRILEISEAYAKVRENFSFCVRAVRAGKRAQCQHLVQRAKNC